MVDWISYTLKIKNWFQGKRQLIVDMDGTGMTANEIIRFLKRNRVDVGHGRFMVDWSLFLMVDDPPKAKKVLAEEGVQAW